MPKELKFIAGVIGAWLVFIAASVVVTLFIAGRFLGVF